MSEWHVTPDYIVNNWSSEMLELMADKMADRKARKNGAPSGNKPIGDRVVSDDQLFKSLGKRLKVVKKGI